MPLEKWSDSTVVVHLADDPQFTDDVEGVEQCLAAAQGGQGKCDAVLDFGSVRFVNSSNIARLLRLRNRMAQQDNRLVLCNLTTQVWGAFLVTGLDKVFTFSDNVPTALATLQMAS
jgi:anti-sigma B factor antagonist